MGVTRQSGGLQKLLETVGGIDGLKTKVGYLGNARYPSGFPVASVAMVQEFGSSKQGIPPRPFFRPTIEKRRNAWVKLAESGAKAMVNGKASPIQVMEGLGLAAEGDIKKTISQITSPPLAPATIAARKAKLSKGKKVGNLTKPLVETGILIKTLTSSVERK